MRTCVKCNQTLKSTKDCARICRACKSTALPSETRRCAFCEQEFIDSSRSKNQKYCSLRCNVDAGHLRRKEKIITGEIIPKKDKRDRRAGRKERYHRDINFRLSISLRARLTGAVKNGKKAGSAVKDLGCSIARLKIKLQLKFYRHPTTGEHMTWDNYGRKGWHIDHIVPISSFDLTNREELLKACHYTNLQPMWAQENHRKSNKLPD